MSENAPRTDTVLNQNVPEAVEPVDPNLVNEYMSSAVLSRVGENLPGEEKKIEEAAPVEEKPGENKPEEKKEEEGMGRRYAQLARREREILQREHSLKGRESQFKEYEQAKANAKKNPKAYIEAVGLTYDDLTSYFLNDEKPTETMEMKQLREELAQVREDIAKEKKDSESAKEKAIIEGFKRDMVHTINQDPDKFELIRSQNEYETVYTIIEQHWRRTGELMPVAFAAEQVEKFLEGEAKKLLGIKKLQARPEPSPLTGDSKPKIPQPGHQAERPKTLTNQVEVPSRQVRRMTREESLSNSAKLLRWNE
jgi:hypothetical protein